MLQDKLRTLFLRVKGNSILMSISILASGTGIAQLFPILSSPILTRLYQPEDFGQYSIFYSLLTVFTGFSTLEYWNAIILADSHSKARNGFFLAFLVSLGLSISILLVVLFISEHLMASLLGAKVVQYLVVLPISVFLSSVSNQFYCWFLRNNDLKFISRNKVVLAIIAAIVQISIGFLQLGAWGLIWANLISLVIANFFFLLRYIRTGYHLIRFPRNLKLLKEVAIEFKKFPQVTVWASLLNIITLQIPDLFINKFFGSSLMGQYSLANRTISIPMTFLSTSIQEVFRKNASIEYNLNKSARNTYKLILKLGASLGILLLIFFVFFAPTLFTYVFGESWNMAGVIVQIMSLLFITRFIVSPLSYIFFIYGKHYVNIFWQIGLFVISLLSLFIGLEIWGKSAFYKLLICYVIGVSIWYLFNLFLTNKISQKRSGS